MGIGAGDEVICPAFTFYATAEAVRRVGGAPVFCDIEPASLNLDPADVAARVSPSTQAILAVHLFGRPAPCRLPGHPGDRAPPRPSAQASTACVPGRSACAATPSASSRQEPLRAGRRRARLHERPGAGRTHPAPPLPRLQGQGDVRGVGDDSRLDAIQPRRCVSSSVTSTAGTPSGARPPRATPSSASASSASCRRTSRGTSTTCTSCARPSGTGSPRRCAPRTSAARRTACAAGLPASRLRGRGPAETERAARETIALPLWAGITVAQQEQVVATIRAAVEQEQRMRLVAATASGRSPPTACSRSPGTWPSRCASTRACRGATTSSSAGTSSPSSSPSKLAVFVRSASTSTGGATSRSATCGGRSSPSRSPRSRGGRRALPRRPVDGWRVPRGSWPSTGCSPRLRVGRRLPRGR